MDRLSDGLHFVRGFCPIEVHDFDIINLTDYEISTIKNEKVLVIKNVKLLLTGFNTKIGLPVEYDKENTNEANISVVIPAASKPIPTNTIPVPSIGKEVSLHILLKIERENNIVS